MPEPTRTASSTAEAGWLDCVIEDQGRPPPASPLIGVLPGEGIGPEVVDAALGVLRRLGDAGGVEPAVEVGGPIGRDAERLSGNALTDEVVEFCDDVFERGGAILSGPGGGRYVYDLRRRFDLFLKISPIQVRNGCPGASPLRSEAIEDVDVLLVRENLGGVYQGRSDDTIGEDGGRVVRHAFSYAEAQVRRFLDAAGRLAASRGGDLIVVTKGGGFPAISSLWRECAEAAAETQGVRCTVVDVDLIAYQLMNRSRDFDVVAASNMCGDMLSDLGAVLLGSRALAFSGNFAPDGAAVYQTNHGAAYDIAGSDRANPAGQILSAAMLLRESLGLEREARAIEEGVRRVWRDGLRTADLNGDGRAAIGTKEMGRLVAEAAADQLSAAVPDS